MLADADVQALVKAVQPKSEDETKAAIVTLTRLQAAAPAKTHVAGVFRANFERRLGNRKDAFPGLRAALLVNPLLTGVWKDLGEMLYDAYQPEEAWRCWDLARRLAPDHRLLSGVREFEERLLKDHPEYFWTPSS